MKISDIYGGAYLKSDHIGGIDGPMPIVTITAWRVEEFEDRTTDQNKKQIVIEFAGKDRHLGLNKTNATKLGSLFGENPDNWIGKKVQLYVVETPMGDGIRVRSAPIAGNVEVTEQDVQDALDGRNTNLKMDDLPF